MCFSAQADLVGGRRARCDRRRHTPTLLPVYVPAAVFVAEPPGPRRHLIRWSIVVGGIVSALLLAARLRGPVTASLDDWHIRYGTGIDAAVPIVGAYVAATCGSLLLSTNRFLVRFGVVNLVAVVVIAIFVVEGFASLWCAWAALASGAVALHLRRAGSAPHVVVIPGV